jgi:1-acyl-sn-glycerol-3-phosphate acyltransferase
LIYRFVRWLLRAALRLYYTEIGLVGRENVPLDGPLMMLGNHNNGMVDPFLMIAASPRPLRFIAKAPLFKVPILGFFLRRLKSVPAQRAQDAGGQKQDNSALYQAVKDSLSSGGAMALFPEGKSHDDPGLAEFKHGAAKMALEAEHLSDFKLGLRVQLVGIHFERTRLYRGKALVTIGPTMTLDSFRDAYAADPRAAVEKLTGELQARLSKMVLDADSVELARLADLAERLTRDEDEDPTIRERFQRKKMLLETYEKLKETRPDDVEELRQQLRRYDQVLRVLHVRDDHVEADYHVGGALLWALKNTILLALGAPFLAVGTVLNAVPYWITRLCVFFAGPHVDMRSSSGLLVAILAFPLWYAVLAWYGWKHIDPRIWIPILASGPITGTFAIRWMERWRKLAKETWAVWIAWRLPAVRKRLRVMRRDIVSRMNALAEAR